MLQQSCPTAVVFPNFTDLHRKHCPVVGAQCDSQLGDSTIHGRQRTTIARGVREPGAQRPKTTPLNPHHRHHTSPRPTPPNTRLPPRIGPQSVPALVPLNISLCPPQSLLSLGCLLFNQSNEPTSTSVSPTPERISKKTIQVSSFSVAKSAQIGILIVRIYVARSRTIRHLPLPSDQRQRPLHQSRNSNQPAALPPLNPEPYQLTPVSHQARPKSRVLRRAHPGTKPGSSMGFFRATPDTYRGLHIQLPISIDQWRLVFPLSIFLSSMFLSQDHPATQRFPALRPLPGRMSVDQRSSVVPPFP